MLKQKDLNLLKAYERRNKEEKIKPWMKYAIVPIGLLMIVVGIYAYITWDNHSIEQNTLEINAQIAKLEEEQSQGNKQEKFTELQSLRTTYNNMQRLYEHMNSYPDLGSHVIDGVFIACGNYVSIDTLSYDLSTGSITISVTTPYVSQSDQVIRRLKETGLFDDVGYQGYTSEQVTQEQNTTPTAPTEDVLSGLSDDELKNALIKKLLEDEAASTITEDHSASSLVYRLNISCTLKKAVSGE